MKIKCMKRDILKAVRIVKKAARKTTSVYTEMVLIETRGNKIVLMVNNLISGIRTELNVDVIKEGKCCVSCENLERILHLMPDREDVMMESKGNEMLIKSGSVKMKLAEMESDRFIILNVDDQDTEVIEISEYLFREMVREVSFSSGNHMSDKRLESIYVEIKNDKLRLVAMDGVRVAQREVRIASSGREACCMIEKKELENIVSLFSSDLTKKIKLLIRKDFFSIENDSLYASGKTVDGVYFDITQILRKFEGLTKTNVEIEKEELLEALLRCEYAQDCNRPTILNIGKTLKLSSDSSKASVEEELAADIAGESLRIGINPTYMKEILKVYPKEKVCLTFADAKSPIFLSYEGYLFLLLPINIK